MNYKNILKLLTIAFFYSFIDLNKYFNHLNKGIFVRFKIYVLGTENFSLNRYRRIAEGECTINNNEVWFGKL